MNITRRSHLTGIQRTRDLPVTGEQLIRLDEGEAIQAVLPHLSPDDREFILTGITTEEWDRYLGPSQ